MNLKVNLSQPGITCSKLTMETLEQGVKFVQKLAIKIPERLWAGKWHSSLLWYVLIISHKICDVVNSLGIWERTFFEPSQVATRSVPLKKALSKN